LVVVDHDIRSDVLLKNGLDQTHILIISHTTTVVDFGTDVVQYLVWHFVEILNEDLKLAPGDHQVFVGEGIGDIPADGSEFTSVLYDSVEETESKEKLFVRYGLGASSERIFIERLVCSKYVLLQTGRGFKGHLYRILEDRHWESSRWHTGEPQAEVSVLGIIDGFNYLLQFWHPRHGQMAVHQKYPSTASQVVINHHCSLGTLSTTERDLINLFLHVHFFSKSHEISDRVGTSAEHEN